MKTFHKGDCVVSLSDKLGLVFGQKYKIEDVFGWAVKLVGLDRWFESNLFMKAEDGYDDPTEFLPNTFVGGYLGATNNKCKLAKGEVFVGYPSGDRLLSEPLVLKVDYTKNNQSSTLASKVEETEFLPNILKRNDNVNHPSHYTSHPSGIECIEVTKHYDFLVGNVIKYCWRAGLKQEGSTNELQDLKKAKWYLEQKIEELKKNK